MFTLYLKHILEPRVIGFNTKGAENIFCNIIFCNIRLVLSNRKYIT